MGRSKMRIKGVYGKPWSRMAGGVPISKKVLEQVGQIIVDAVVAECKKDFARYGSFATTISGDTKESLYDSFGWRIKGKSTIEITSTWDIEPFTEGKGWELRPAKKPNAKLVVPIMEGGTVVFRMAPFTTKQGTWVHPGFGKMSFIQRGIRKGKEKAAHIITAEVGRALIEGNPFR